MDEQIMSWATSRPEVSLSKTWISCNGCLCDLVFLWLRPQDICQCL